MRTSGSLVLAILLLKFALAARGKDNLPPKSIEAVPRLAAIAFGVLSPDNGVFGFRNLS